jgi:hypothetical protein
MRGLVSERLQQTKQMRKVGSMRELREAIMRRSAIAAGFVFLALGACGSRDEERAALTAGAVEADDMPLYCAREASDLFDVDVRDILISPIDDSGGISTLIGQYPGVDDEPRGFQCQFDPDGNFISVVPT